MGGGLLVSNGPSLGDFLDPPLSIANVAAARVTIHISYIQSFIVVWLIVPKLQKQNIPMTETPHYFCCGLYVPESTPLG